MKTGRKKKGRSAAAPPSAPTPPGHNRRAVAMLTRKLADDLDKIEAQKKMLAKQETRLFNTYKKDTGRSKRATRRALGFYRMDDSTARSTEINDQIEVMRDLGMGADMPLFKEAANEAALQSDLDRERAAPGFIDKLGRQAFADGVKFDACPYDGIPTDDARKAKEKWEWGWQGALKDKEDKKRAPAPAPAPEDATKH